MNGTPGQSSETTSGAISEDARNGVFDRRRGQKDRRGGKRVPFVAAVAHEARVDCGPSGSQIGLSDNLGLSGMRVLRPCAKDEAGLPSCAPVSVSFQLPGEDHLVTLRSEVVFDHLSEEDRPLRVTGLRFLEVPKEVEERLRRYLAG